MDSRPHAPDASTVLASDRVEIDAAFDMRVVSKDCGFYFNGVISAV